MHRAPPEHAQGEDQGAASDPAKLAIVADGAGGRAWRPGLRARRLARRRCSRAEQPPSQQVEPAQVFDRVRDMPRLGSPEPRALFFADQPFECGPGLEWDERNDNTKA